MNDHVYDWTVMVYLSGDNNLSSEMLWALTEIERASEVLGEQNRIALTVQYDPISPAVGTLRYSLQPPRNAAAVANRPAFPVPFSEALRAVLDGEVLNGEDAASPLVLGQFIQWSTENFPSEHRMLILSGHGSGAEGDFLTDNNPGPAANGAGLHAGNGAHAVVAARLVNRDAPLLQPGTLTIPALGLVLNPPEGEGAALLAAAPGIHVLGMDSCLMSTLEVAHQVSGGVQFMVGSEGFIPNTGWPYFELLTRFQQQLDIDPGPAAMSALIVDVCADSYADYLAAGVSLDIASCELAHIPDVADAVRPLAGLLTAHIAERPVQNAVILAHWRAQGFKLEQYTDLWDFCNELAEGVRGDPYGIEHACLGVLRAINRVLGIAPSADPRDPGGRGRQRSLGVDFQYARGLSVYFPWCAPTGAGVDYFEQYRRLGFPQASGWGDFLAAYHRETMRGPRIDGQRNPEDVRLINMSGRGQMALTKNVSEYNKNVSEYNKFISQMFGGRTPWCTRNQPQQADVSPQPRAADVRPEQPPDGSGSDDDAPDTGAPVVVTSESERAGGVAAPPDCG
jgi:hypothetical protein